MSVGRRVLLLGVGPKPGPESRGVRFAQLRTEAFATALRGAGHRVRVLYLAGDDPQTRRTSARLYSPSGWEGEFVVSPGQVRGLLGGETPEVLVSAGPFSAGAVAWELREIAPWFADLPGDPFAELAAARNLRGDSLGEREAEYAREVALRVLCGADRLGVISEGQRHAALGQLGLLGRDLEDQGRLVRVLPISTPLGPPTPARERAPRLGVVVGGAQNGWQDGVGTGSLIRAGLEQFPWLEVEITGDGLAGLAPAELIARFGGRVRVHGELTETALAAVWSRCGLGLSLDRPIVETELGSRTRLIHWAWAGLELVGGGGTPLARSLIHHQGMWAVEPTDVQGFLAALAAIWRGERRVSHAQQVLQQYYRQEVALDGLLDFVAAPHRSRPGREQEGALLMEIQHLRAELQAIRGSPTWRLLDRLRRRLPGPLGEGRKTDR